MMHLLIQMPSFSQNLVSDRKIQREMMYVCMYVFCLFHTTIKAK